jgi:hypothetical protein
MDNTSRDFFLPLYGLKEIFATQKRYGIVSKVILCKRIKGLDKLHKKKMLQLCEAENFFL